MYRFARQPKWVLSHVFVLALVGAMIGLGFWQLQRLSDRQTTNQLVEARADSTPLRYGDAIAGERRDDGSLDDVRYLRVGVSGEYLDETIFIDNRSFEGAPGSWLATPFRLADTSETVLVVRGFVSRSFVLNAGPAELAPPAGTQELVGLLQPGASGGAFARDREGPAAISRPNVVAVADRLAVELDDVYVQLESPIETQLTAVPLPEINDGPHLSYAIQWFVFAIIGIIGYPLILRRRASAPTSRKRQDESVFDASSNQAVHW